jgi:ATP synthase protein I
MAPEKHREKSRPTDEQRMAEQVGAKETRKLRARSRREESVWFGLGMFGIVGWSVAIPTLIGVALGIWIDVKWPSRFSWTLMCLIMGILLGCLNAWFWVTRERKSISRSTEEKTDD